MTVSSWPGIISSMAASAMTVPRMGWAENKMNSLFGSKLWFTLWPRVALYLVEEGGFPREIPKDKKKLPHNHCKHHCHPHGDIVAHVSGDVNAQVLLLPRQVEGDVVHVPGGDDALEDTYHHPRYHDSPFMFCIITEFPSVKSSQARLAVDDETGVESNHLVVVVMKMLMAIMMINFFPEELQR